MNLLPYDGTMPPLPRAPGWPHADTAAALSFWTYGGWTWLVVDDDGRLAGECGAKGPPDAAGVVEIGYGLAGPSRGHGLGGRAVRALLDQLAARGVRMVVAEVDVGNHASRRLLERLGFAITDADAGSVRYRADLSPPPTPE